MSKTPRLQVNLQLKGLYSGVSAIAVVFYSIFIARSSFIFDDQRYFTLFDDAMISMRYARNLAEGHGLLWNIGETPIEGYTNFLWTIWLTILHLLPTPESKIALGVMLTGIVILVTNYYVIILISQQLTQNKKFSFVPLIAGSLVVFYYPLTYWTLRGMEVGLLTLALNCSILLILALQELVC